MRQVSRHIILYSNCKEEAAVILNNPDEIACNLPEEGAALGLLGLMKGISESGWCAGWMGGIEYDLWCAKAGKEVGMKVITGRQATLLRLLSDECDGWWYWTEQGPTFIRLDAWKEKLKFRR